MKICTSCRVGRLRERLTTYIEWHGHTLLVANRMPTLICDVCGERAYDDEAMEDLQQLLWSEASNHPRSMSNLGN